MLELFIDITGWIGSLEVIAAYLIVSFEKGKINKKVYQGLNLTGSLFLIVNTIYYGAYPSTFVNVIWMIIAFISLFKIAKLERVKPSDSI